jgi:hypothetical protein
MLYGMFDGPNTVRQTLLSGKRLMPAPQPDTAACQLNQGIATR